MLLILLNINTFAQGSKPNKPKKFAITIENVGNDVLKFKCPSNCAWLELSFYSKYKPMELLDEYGMTTVGYSRTTIDERLADFLFSVDLKDDKIFLKGLHGTAWTELNFPLPTGGIRTFNETGVEEL